MLTKAAHIQEITLRICSSLDINVAVGKTFEYLKKLIPLDLIFLDILDNNLKSIRRIVEYPTGKRERPTIVPLPEKLWSWVQALKAPKLMGSLSLGDLGLEMGELVDLEGNSDLALPLRIEDTLVGILVFRTQGKDKYTEKHAEFFNCVTDPFALALANALAHEEVIRYRDTLIDDNCFLKQELKKCWKHQEVIGENDGLSSVMEMVEKVAPLTNKILLLGETGTGKEVIANAIHSASPRADGPFIKVNCGAIPDALIDSELFGHEKGAFTGAQSTHRGRFERADRGTLFLDEIGELPLKAQTRLLRVLQTQEIERIGGKRTIQVDVRLIAATHQNLEKLVQEGRFREDLWFRLNVFPIIIPPLRQRTEDIPALISHFLKLKSRELGLRQVPPIAPGRLQKLMDYHWPGNVRELENMVERELIQNREGPLCFEKNMPSSLRRENIKHEILLPELKTLDDLVSNHIIKTLGVTHGKIHGPGGAAEMLGVNANTLRNRMNKLGIDYIKNKKVGVG